MDKQPLKDGWTHVDARAMRCPIPALRLARAIREGGPGQYQLSADDPAAQKDIPALCRERGWILHSAGQDHFLVQVQNRD